MRAPVFLLLALLSAPLVPAGAYAQDRPLADRPFWRDASASLPAKAPNGRSMNAKAADIDGDGDIDLVIAMEFAPNRLLLNDGTGRFRDASSQLPPNARDSEEVVLLDFDQDGDLDIVVANEDDLRPELYRNEGQARFSDASALLGGLRVKANAVVALDANADGIADLFFGGDKVSHLLIGKKGGGFVDESPIRLPETYGGTQDVAVGDINNDGFDDLVLGNEDRSQLYLGSAQGVFRLETLPLKEPLETRDVELFDANGDGLLDLYLANVRLWNPRAVLQDKLLLSTLNGLMEASMAWLPAREQSTLSALPFDYDQDGKTDLLLSTLGSSLGGPNFDGRLILLRNTGNAFVDMSQAHLPANLPGTPGFDVVSADFDGDNKPDLFVSGRIGPDLLLLTR